MGLVPRGSSGSGSPKHAVRKTFPCEGFLLLLAIAVLLIISARISVGSQKVSGKRALPGHAAMEASALRNTTQRTTPIVPRKLVQGINSLRTQTSISSAAVNSAGVPEVHSTRSGGVRVADTQQRLQAAGLQNAGQQHQQPADMHAPDLQVKKHELAHKDAAAEGAQKQQEPLDAIELPWDIAAVPSADAAPGKQELHGNGEAVMQPLVQSQQQQQLQDQQLLQSGTPLPWRALFHLDPNYSRTPSSSKQQGPAPAYLVSAFLDTRPMVFQANPQVAVIMAVNKRSSTHGWKCLLQLHTGQQLNRQQQQQAESEMVVRHRVLNNEDFFDFEASTGFCDLPASFQNDMLLAENSNSISSTTPGKNNETAKQESWPQLRVTIVGPNGVAPASSTSSNSTSNNGSNGSSSMHVDTESLQQQERRQQSEQQEQQQQQQDVWASVHVIPLLPQTVRNEYASGKGTAAVCAPPVHTDAYASTLIEWVEFQKLMGVSQITLYSFNPGPLIKPLMDFYAAQGTLDVFEWIIPASILKDQQQECKLPFFHASGARLKYGSPACTYHQDNYQIAHWGQTLAVQDCVYRAMAAQHRWVAVVDLDEYILPKQAATPNWSSVIQTLAAQEGRPAAEYGFAGFKLCSGCTQQQQHEQAAAGACASPPRIGFHHLLWSKMCLASSDYKKSIVDPFAVGQASVHSTAAFSNYAMASGTVDVPRDIAVKLHDRVHDIHKGDLTFAARMLPLLKANIGAVAVVTAAAAAAADKLKDLPAYPTVSSDCSVCGSVDISGSLAQDLTMCSLYGNVLLGGIADTVSEMKLAGTFSGATDWGSDNISVGNLYGGFVFDEWAPPKKAVK